MKERESRGLTRLVAIAVALAASCALILGTNFFSVKAEAGNETQATTAGYTWFELIDDDRELVIHLNDYLDGYDWKYGMDRECLEELHGFEMTNEETQSDKGIDYSIHFKAAYEEDTETKLVFMYLKDRDSEPVETRTITVRTKANRFISVE